MSASTTTVIALRSSGDRWRACAQALPDGVTLHAPDLPGYGSDAVWPVRAAEVLASACPGATLVRLPGAGHLAPIREPARALPCLPFGGPSSWPLAA